MDIKYKIVSFDKVTGTIVVLFYSNEYPSGLVFNIDIPIENGKYISGDALHTYIMTFAPYGQINRILLAQQAPDPEITVEPIPVDPVQKVEQNKIEASLKLSETNWTQLPDVPLLNRQDFIVYRDLLREIAINPPDTDVTWPVKPTAVWS